jgi:hypothetical protein
MSSRVESITCSHPWALAIAAFWSEPTVPITVAPRAFSHWQAISPTPPAAAWNRTVSPAFTGYVVVDPDGGVPDAGLPRARLADLDVLPAHDLGAAGLVNSNRFRHGRLLGNDALAIGLGLRRGNKPSLSQ